VNLYLAVKVVHVLSATILFGTGLGIAFFKWIVDRSNNVTAIRIISEKVVLADWLFTTPAIVIQALSGAYMAAAAGFSPARGWLLYAVLLFLLAGACWVPVVWLQMRMRDLARASDREGTNLSPEFYRYARIWFALGIPAFLSLVIVFWLMVAKPS
jgi:uncharacterized membrane protein